MGHFVNYRKQVSPSMQQLLPESDFRLFAVCVRFPAALARQVALTTVRPGVYDVAHFSGKLRLVVVHQLPQQEHNATLHLFSAQAGPLRWAAGRYKQHPEETSTLLLQLFNKYRLEALSMPDLLQQLARDTIDELLRSLSPEERLKGLPAEERLKGLSPDDVLAALSPETREVLASRLKDEGASTKPE